MPLPETSLSRASRSIADFIQSSFTAAGHPIQVRLGTPAAAQPATTDTEHRLNLFFHRFEPMGFGSHELPNQTLWIRVYCIIDGVCRRRGSDQRRRKRPAPDRRSPAAVP